jgi:multidrug efflux pump subunit AcrB
MRWKAQNLSQNDVVTALSNENLVFPSGTAKIGSNEYPIDLNTSPSVIDRLNELPIKTVEGTVIRVRDVAQVRDGYMPQQNVVRQDGARSTLISILKNGSASTLQVASGVKASMAAVLKTVAENIQVKQFADQSMFVKAAVSGVVREGVIAAALTALMILLFLGSWRSTLIIAVSIPLSILASLAALSALGETINLMTLGGLALAVGILVDDATVTIENIERHMSGGEALETAYWRAPARSPCRPWSRPCASASSSSPCSFSPASRDSCSRRWPRPSYSRSWRRMACPARSCRRW